MQGANPCLQLMSTRRVNKMNEMGVMFRLISEKTAAKLFVAALCDKSISQHDREYLVDMWNVEHKG